MLCGLYGRRVFRPLVDHLVDQTERLGVVGGQEFVAFQRVLDRLPEGGRAIAVGHSPTNEAAILGLTGQIVPPLAKGAGVLVATGDDRYQIEALD